MPFEALTLASDFLSQCKPPISKQLPTQMNSLFQPFRHAHKHFSISHLPTTFINLPPRTTSHYLYSPSYPTLTDGVQFIPRPLNGPQIAATIVGKLSEEVTVLCQGFI